MARTVIEQKGNSCAEQIRFLRKYLGWSQTDLAAYMSVGGSDGLAVGGRASRDGPGRRSAAAPPSQQPGAGHELSDRPVQTQVWKDSEGHVGIQGEAHLAHDTASRGVAPFRCEVQLNGTVPIIQFIPILMLGVWIGFVANALARDKGRNVRSGPFWASSRLSTFSVFRFLSVRPISGSGARSMSSSNCSVALKRYCLES